VVYRKFALTEGMKMVGKTISHYKILEKLGEGGMGIVYKAQDLKLDRFVALKFLPLHPTTSGEEKERFIHEAKSASALQHNNICAIHEIDETEDGLIFICMDYYEGDTLNKKINEKPLPLEEAIDIAIQIAQGLTKAHQKEIVHRDIKPANIMLTMEGVIKLLDFGLAKLPTQTKLTKEGTTLGTIAYISPEQARGDEVDYRTDIWSLGVIIYEMLIGQLPFKGDYDQAVLYSIINDEIDPITELRSGLPMELEQIITKCLQKDPADRYQHVDEIIVDLRSLKKESESVSPPLKEDSIKKRSKTLKISSAVLIIIIIVFAGYFFIFEQDKSEIADDGLSKWENSIAVLPFADLSPGKDQEYFCDGMTEQIITNLSKIKRLKVIARTSVMIYKNTNKQIPEIGKELSVTHILEGSIRKHGNNIRVTAQLINTKDGSHLWADDFDRKLEHVFEVQDDVSQAIASNLLVTLTPEEMGGIKTNRSSNTEAYEYYMKGRYFHINKFFLVTSSLDDFNKSETLLKKAIELDPEYAPSYAELADLYNTYYNEKAQDVDEKKKYLDLQEEYIDSAYKLDPYSAEVNLVMGYVQTAKGEIEKAYNSYKKAILIQPGRMDSHYSLADFYRERGLSHLAIKHRTKAIELNPLHSNSYAQRAISFNALGEIEKAEKDLQKALELDPNHEFALYLYGMLLVVSENYDEAEELISRREKIYPESIRNRALRAWLYAAIGEKDKALEIDLGTTFYGYTLYFFLKMKEEIISHLIEDLERVRQSKESWYIWFMKYPLYEFLHSDSRFQEIMAIHKELYEENMRKYGDVDM
jgi:non-specific serine/threonine protein kinase